MGIGDIKIKYLSQSGLEEYIATDQDDKQSVQVVQAFVDQLKDIKQTIYENKKFNNLSVDDLKQI